MTDKPKETCALAKNTEGYLKYASDESSYSHEHLSTLYFITKLSNAHRVLEIGCGHSTIAFSQALYEMGFRGRTLTTVDISEERYNEIKPHLKQNTMFVLEDGINYHPYIEHDIIFIDDLHEYEQVKKEIMNLHSYVKVGGFFVFHDTNNFAHEGVRKAIDESMILNSPDWQKFEWLHCNGLMIFRRMI